MSDAPEIVITASPECVSNVVDREPGKPPDFTVTKAEMDHILDNYLEIEWETKSAGFGVLTLYRTPEGKLRCDNESMSRNFVKAVLVKLADTLVLDS